MNVRTKDEVDSIYSREDLEKKIVEIPRWWHIIELGSRVKTPGIYDKNLMEWVLNSFPKDFSEKSVLDIGARDGLFSFECESRNAKEIIGIDIFQGYEDLHDKPFRICKEILGSKAEILHLDVLDVEKLNKKFDIILFLGIYYHMKNPFLALEKLFNVCKELVILEGEILQTERSIAYLLEPGEIGGDTSNTFLFSPVFLQNYASRIGFRRVEFIGYASTQGPIIQSDIKNSVNSENTKNELQPLRRNRGIFYLWI
jgi:tRNA (mo5U34)-methyltransferase